MLASLHEVGSRLWFKRDLRRALDEILAGAIELLGADMGIVQILDSARGVLKIEAHGGFNQDFLDSFSKMSAAGGSSCGRAFRSGERIVTRQTRSWLLSSPRPRGGLPRDSVNTKHKPRGRAVRHAGDSLPFCVLPHCA